MPRRRRTRDQIRRISCSRRVVWRDENDGSRSRSDEFASVLDGGKEGGSVGLKRDGLEREESHQHVVVEVAASKKKGREREVSSSSAKRQKDERPKSRHGS